MNNKIMMFIIGALVGAILATGAFYLFVGNNNCSNNIPMSGGEPPEKPSGEPPERPSDDNNQNTNQEGNN